MIIIKEEEERRERPRIMPNKTSFFVRYPLLPLLWFAQQLRLRYQFTSLSTLGSSDNLVSSTAPAGAVPLI